MYQGEYRQTDNGETKYRVRTNYWTISLDHIFNNKRKYMKLLKEECLQFCNYLKCIRCAHHV
jgi:hypothetical protein